MKALRLLVVPFDAGVEGKRMGAGPAALEDGLVKRLQEKREQLDNVEIVRIQPSSPWRAELQSTFELHHRLAEEVRISIAIPRFPLILAGDCNMTVAAIAGLGSNLRTGILWLDAHADFNTPDSDASESGVLKSAWASSHKMPVRKFDPRPAIAATVILQSPARIRGKRGIAMDILTSSARR